MTEFPGAHDLGADVDVVESQDGVVDAPGAAGLADSLVPGASLEHPLVESISRVPEVEVTGLTFAGAEAVE
jgi:hypothetical protein